MDIARFIFLASGDIEEPLRHALAAAYFILYHHEQFHHLVESYGIRVENSLRRPIYVSYADSVYKPAKGTADLVEEALANAYAFRALERSKTVNFFPGRAIVVNQIRDAALAYLQRRFPIDPPGYNRALEFVSDSDFSRGCALLISQIMQTSRKPILTAQAPLMLLKGDFDPLFGEEKIRCVEIRDAAQHQVLNNAVLPFDNRAKELQRLLRRKGFSLKRQGAHEIWAKPGSPPIPVPRSRRLADWTAEAILKAIDPTYRVRNFRAILKRGGSLRALDDDACNEELLVLRGSRENARASAHSQQ